MHNDNRNASPRIGRGLWSVVLSVVAVGAGLLAAVVSFLGFVGARPASVRTAVPLQPDDMQALLDRWPEDPGLVADAQNVVWVTASNLDPRLAQEFAAAGNASQVLTILLSLLLAGAGITHLFGRLRWGALALLVSVGGGLLVVGTLWQGFLQGAAMESFSMSITGGKVWFEPGFLLGVDFTAVLAGSLFVVLGLALSRVASYAGDAHGVV